MPGRAKHAPKRQEETDEESIHLSDVLSSADEAEVQATRVSKQGKAAAANKGKPAPPPAKKGGKPVSKAVVPSEDEDEDDDATTLTMTVEDGSDLSSGTETDATSATEEEEAPVGSPVKGHIAARSAASKKSIAAMRRRLDSMPAAGSADAGRRWERLTFLLLGMTFAVLALVGLGGSLPFFPNEAAADTAKHATHGTSLVPAGAQAASHASGADPSSGHASTSSGGGKSNGTPHRMLVTSFAGEKPNDLVWLLTFFNDMCIKVYGRVPNPWWPEVAAPNLGKEGAVYLKFIIDHYERMPEHVVFLHGHRFSWHNEDLVPLIRNLNWSLPYANLNYKALPDNPAYYKVTGDPKDISARRYQILRSVWGELFEDVLGPIPPHYSTWCCAQFMVSKAMILQYPKSFYERLFSWLTSEATGFLRPDMDILMEHAWSLLWKFPIDYPFGELPDEQCKVTTKCPFNDDFGMMPYDRKWKDSHFACDASDDRRVLHEAVYGTSSAQESGDE